MGYYHPFVARTYCIISVFFFDLGKSKPVAGIIVLYTVLFNLQNPPAQSETYLVCRLQQIGAGIEVLDCVHVPD